MKALFIGLGSVGQRHLRNLMFLAKDNVELLACRSKNLAPLLSQDGEADFEKDVGKHYNITEFLNLNEALDKSPDIVFITNPNSEHMTAAAAAADAGCDLFIEKPLSHDLLGTSRLLKVVKHKQIIATVGYQYRFHPGIKIAKKWLDDNRIGRIVSASFVNGEYLPDWHPWEDYRQSYGARDILGGGAIATQIHEYDLVYWLFGLPNSVFAVGGQLSSLDVDVEDSVTALFTVPSESQNIPVDVHLDYLQSPPVRKFTIVGDRGRIVWNEQKKSIKLYLVDQEEAETAIIKDYNRNDMFINIMQDFLLAVETRRKPEVDIKTGIKSLVMAQAAKESMMTGKAIKLSSVKIG